MKLNICANIYETSGYGEFARGFIQALHSAGVSLTVEPIGLQSKVDLGPKGRLAHSLVRRSAGCDVNVVIMVPTTFQAFHKPGKLNIGFTMWESSALPNSWIPLCNKQDAIFVPSTWNRKVFKDSGVTVPIEVVFPGLEGTPPPKPKRVPGQPFKFYSIFQWIERKNPQALFKAYFSEFAGQEDVLLVIKTYRHASLPNNDAYIREQLEQLKKEVRLSKPYPSYVLTTEFLTHDAIVELHRGSDCFVLPHRGEGFGLPHATAMYYGNPVIATQYSGNTDFMHADNSYPLDYHLTPVTDMHWWTPWFMADQQYWAEPSVYQLAKTMRAVYADPVQANLIGLAGQKTILNSFSAEHSAQAFLSAVQKLRSN